MASINRARRQESAAGNDDGRRIVAGIILCIPLKLPCKFWGQVGGVCEVSHYLLASI